MKLEFEFDGRRAPAEFTLDGDEASLTIDGKTRRGVISEPEPGIYVVLLDDRVYRCTISKSAPGRIEVGVNDESFDVTVIDRKRYAGGSGGGMSHGRVSLTAPMPGKIVRLLIEAGEPVAAHQGVLIVEAMKMQNEVQSPKEGTVTEIRVSEGQTVSAGEVLAVID
ncbi:MAG: biotin/lipoyl-binding protein [Acidobacteriota bacterium]|nr:MAG: biotin/lipoyl-binding protein [Acidobacteriota bacterium]